jgi:hypothetical protein
VFDDLQSEFGYRRRNEKWKEIWRDHVNMLKQKREEARARELSEANEVRGEGESLQDKSSSDDVIAAGEDSLFSATADAPLPSEALVNAAAAATPVITPILPTTSASVNTSEGETAEPAIGSAEDEEIEEADRNEMLSSQDHSNTPPEEANIDTSTTATQPPQNVANVQQKKQQKKKQKQQQQQSARELPATAAGYLIGPADVYGGDYTLYKTADPSQSHSVATVRIVANHNSDGDSGKVYDGVRPATKVSDKHYVWCGK